MMLELKWTRPFPGYYIAEPNYNYKLSLIDIDRFWYINIVRGRQIIINHRDLKTTDLIVAQQKAQEIFDICYSLDRFM